VTRIGLLTTVDMSQPWARSTNIHFMAQALASLCDDWVDYGPAQATGDPLRRLLARASDHLAPAHRYSPDYSLRRARQLGRIFQERFRQDPVDVVLAPKGSISLAFLRLPVPVVYVSDATFARLEGYYPSATGLSARSAGAAHDLEKRTLAGADALVYHTRWAAESAISDYGANPAKVFQIPSGANLDRRDLPTAEEVQDRAASGACRLLFLGVDWDRKGGSIALETLEGLLSRGVDAELVVCGCRIPAGARHPKLRHVRHLSKADPDERRQLSGLFREATFFVLPTRAECAGSVFSEASAFGLPSVGTRTGGVPELIREGVNGFTLPLEARGDAYAELIASVFTDPARYADLCRTSREQFEQRLSWDVWAGRVWEEVLTPLLEARRGGVGG